MMFVIVALVLVIISFCQLSSTLQCYECTGYVPCGSGQTHLLVNCPGKCMVYKNQFDQGMIIRRCCYNNCGTDGTTSIYEGRLTYFCSSDRCNGDGADNNLSGGGGGIVEEGSGEEFQSTTTQFFSITTTVTVTTTLSQSSSMSCHECTGHYSGCGTSQHTIIHNCRMCMVYRNIWDGNMIVRRCCYWDCGPANAVRDYEGRQTYFCASNLCNGIGSESALTSTKGQFVAGDSFPSN